MPENYDGPERRQPDPIQTEIESLIKAAADPKDRAFLMIMNKMASSLDVNTELTRTLSKELKTHTDRFEIHEKRETEIFNQGRGFVYAMLLCLGVFQAMGVWWVTGHLGEMEQMQKDLNAQMVAMAEHKEHHRQEEKYRDVPKVK